MKNEIRFKKAKWIENPSCPQEATPVFTTKVVLKTTENAVALVCGLGFYVLKINEKKVGDDLLAPPFTAYDKRVVYQSYAVSAYLKPGENEIEIICGNGWYHQVEADAWEFEHAAWKAAPKAIFELFVHGKSVAATDSSWHTATGKTIFNSLRCGETFDAAKITNDSRNAVIARAPGGVLVRQEMPPVKLQNCYEGKELFPFVYDFGQSVTGNVEIEAEGKKGDEIAILYSERLRDDGTIDREEISRLVFSKRFAEDKYWLKGEGKEKWHGSFSFHGFRYVRVYYPETTRLISVTARDIHTDLKETGGYICNDEKINRLHRTTMRSVLTNYVHIPMDCPQREKNGWTADAMLSSYQTLYNFDIKTSYIKYLDDIVDCQRPNGAIPCIAPTSIWGYQWGSGVTWDATLFVIPWNIYLFTGDESVLERYRGPMRRYLAFLDTQTDNDIFTIGLGDWCAPEECEKIETEAMLTCYAKHVYDIYAKICAVFGDTDESKNAEKRSGEIRKAFRKRFEGKHAQSQTYYAALAYFDMTDDKQAAADQLAALVKKDGGHIYGGIFGALIIPVVLREYGYFDIAWKMVTTETYPSWLYLADKCSGTFGEAWRGSESRDHHMFSSVDAFIHSSLSGLMPNEKFPGFKEIHLKPYFPKGIDEFSAYYTINGKRLEISLKKGVFAVTMPEGVAGVIEIGGEEKTLQKGNNIFNLR